LFQADHVSKPADNVTCPAEQQPASDQAFPGTGNAVLNEGAIRRIEEPSEGKSNSSAISLDEISAKERQNGENLNPVTTCCATSPSCGSDVTVASVTAEEISTATNTSASAQTSKGVIIRPISAASKSADKEYVQFNQSVSQSKHIYVCK